MPDVYPGDQDAVIRVDGLRKTFDDGDEAVTAIEDISFEIERGSVVGLLGPNGAGKTTTIKSMLGLMLPDAGTININGVDIHRNPSRAYDNVGAILEGARNIYWRLTVRENLEFFAGLGGDSPEDLRPRHNALLERFDLADRADTPVKKLSRGMKQKVSLASTLARDVDVVFMDEPTLGLDIETSLELRSELTRLSNREEMTIIVSSHDMDVIESVCDSVIVLDEGSIVEFSKVDELLEVFRTRQFQVALDQPLTKETSQRLERKVDAECTDGEHQYRITFTSAKDNAIYNVMDIIRTSDCEIRDIEALKPDLEEIFLKLTEAEETGSEPQGISRPGSKKRPVVATNDPDVAPEVATDDNN